MKIRALVFFITIVNKNICTSHILVYVTPFNLGFNALQMIYKTRKNFQIITKTTIWNEIVKKMNKLEITCWVKNSFSGGLKLKLNKYSYTFESTNWIDTVNSMLKMVKLVLFSRISSVLSLYKPIWHIRHNFTSLSLASFDTSLLVFNWTIQKQHVFSQMNWTANISRWNRDKKCTQDFYVQRNFKGGKKEQRV